MGQMNLVKNPSFEKRFHNYCTVGEQKIKIAENWNSIDTAYIWGSSYDTFHLVGDPYCTPTYFNSCDTTVITSVPHNIFGYQFPRTGDAFAGSFMYSLYDTSGYLYQRQYLLGHLYHSLIAGHSYCITFYVNLANRSSFIVNHIGAYLDDGSIDTNSSCGLPHPEYSPQVYETTIISDTLGWTKIQGSFIANGTERYITVGNFFSNMSTDTIRRFPWFGTGTIYAIYYIDDVSVIASDSTAYAGVSRFIHAGDTTYLGLDSNGEGMPCYWYIPAIGASPIDSGGTIMVHPTTTTTYLVEMDLCGTLTRDSVTVTVVPVGIASPQPSPRERECTV